MTFKVPPINDLTTYVKYLKQKIKANYGPTQLLLLQTALRNPISLAIMQTSGVVSKESILRSKGIKVTIEYNGDYTVVKQQENDKKVFAIKGDLYCSMYVRLIELLITKFSVSEYGAPLPIYGRQFWFDRFQDQILERFKKDNNLQEDIEDIEKLYLKACEDYELQNQQIAGPEYEGVKDWASAGVPNNCTVKNTSVETLAIITDHPLKQDGKHCIVGAQMSTADLIIAGWDKAIFEMQDVVPFRMTANVSEAVKTSSREITPQLCGPDNGKPVQFLQDNWFRDINNPLYKKVVFGNNDEAEDFWKNKVSKSLQRVWHKKLISYEPVPALTIIEEAAKQLDISEDIGQMLIAGRLISMKAQLKLVNGLISLKSK